MSVKQNDPAKPTQHRSHGSDLAAKILCTLAAFFLWIYVMSVESPEYEQIFSHLTVELAGTDASTPRAACFPCPRIPISSRISGRGTGRASA